MASKTLTAKVKFDTSSAEKSLTRLAKKINNVQNAINKTSRGNSLEKQINRAVAAQEKLNRSTSKTRNAINQSATSANRLSNSFKTSNTNANHLLTTVKRLAHTYLGVMGTKAILNTSDSISSTQNKLNTLNGGDTKLTQNQMDKMYTSANKVRMAYTDMMANASKSMTLAGDAFQGNMDNAIRFQEIMAETYTLGGASAPEMSTSMYQMIQALGSGTLQGDELRSVREGAPLAYKAIEEFAQGVLNTNESLKELASQGKITSDMVVAAIMNAGDKIDAQFNQTQMTFGQAWNRIISSAVKAFEPVSNLLRDMLNKAAENGAFEKIETVFWNLSKVLQIVFQLIYLAIETLGSIFGWVSDNWDWLSRVILTAILLIGTVMAVVLFPKFIAWLSYIAFAIVYYTWLGITAVASAIKTAAAWALAHLPLLLLILVIVAVIGAVIWLADSFEDACGMIVGVVLAAVSVVWNLFVTMVMLIIKCAMLPLARAWDAFANLFANIFNDPIATIIGCFEGLATSVLGILETIARGIDAIFGSNLTSAVQGWQESLKGKAGELIEKYGNGSYEDKSDVADKVNEVLNSVQTSLLWDTSSAYNTGYDWGSSAGGKISDALGSFGEGLNLDSIGNKLGLEFGSGFPSGGGAGGGYSTPDDLLKDIANDTGSMAGSMDLAEEDLSYLRKIAEMEWKKEFTTAEIKVEMNNNNQINGESDLDGIVTKLADKLYEEMNVVANGVYA